MSLNPGPHRSEEFTRLRVMVESTSLSSIASLEGKRGPQKMNPDFNPDFRIWKDDSIVFYSYLILSSSLSLASYVNTDTK